MINPCRELLDSLNYPFDTPRGRYAPILREWLRVDSDGPPVCVVIWRLADGKLLALRSKR